jgi:mono/diheme cytochrome c family protein
MKRWVAVLGVVLGGVGPGGASAEDAASVARGEAVYQKLCFSCHGRYGRGDGPGAGELALRPPDFTDSALLAGRSDDAVYQRLRENSAHTPMATAGVVKEESFRDALAYVRSLSVPGKHVSLLAGRDIFNGSCWVCHGPEGDGKGPAARNVKPPPRDFTSPEFEIEGREEEVYRTISQGAAASFHGSAFMPEWGTKLTPQQIRDVMEYLKTFRKAR